MNVLKSFYTLICNNFFTIILLLLLLSAGDVERNPGQDQTTEDLSILQLNIRRIRNKLDFIKDNFMDSNILCLYQLLLLRFLTVTCSCCPYLYFGSAILLVTYFVNFR